MKPDFAPQWPFCNRLENTHRYGYGQTRCECGDFPVRADQKVHLRGHLKLVWDASKLSDGEGEHGQAEE
jgi:hypothetical protein